MKIVFEIQQPNPKNIPSPFLETDKLQNNSLEKRMEEVGKILDKLLLNYEIKSGSNLTLISSEPTIEMDLFMKTYG